MLAGGAPPRSNAIWFSGAEDQYRCKVLDVGESRVLCGGQGLCDLADVLSRRLFHSAAKAIDAYDNAPDATSTTASFVIGTDIRR